MSVGSAAGLLFAAAEAPISIPTWVPVFLLAGGVWGVVAGLLFRAGRLRRLGRWYFDADVPWYVRNLPFEQLPAGLMFLSGAAMILFYLQGTTWADLLGVVALFAFLVTVLAFARVALRPPQWMKPMWLRELETNHIPTAERR